MRKRPPMLTAEELDTMSPNQRLAAFRERLITDPEDLPAELRLRVFTTTRALVALRSQRLTD